MIATFFQDPQTSLLKLVGLVVAAIAFLIFLFVFLRYANLYVRSILTNAGVGLLDMVAMSLRRVNPVIDGMNLVAMEGPLLNRRRGVLVLSRNAGAYGRLGRYALAVNPFDLRETADALERGLDMPMDERARRSRGLSRLVLANPPSRWVGGQLEDLRRAARRRA